MKAWRVVDPSVLELATWVGVMLFLVTLAVLSVVNP